MRIRDCTLSLVAGTTFEAYLPLGHGILLIDYDNDDETVSAPTRTSSLVGKRMVYFELTES